MTTRMHADIAFGATGASATVNAALGQLDSALADAEAVVGGDLVVTGGLASTSADLHVTVPATRAFVINTYVSIGATTLLLTASKDSYIDLDSAGVLHVSEVANGAGAPAVFASSIRLCKAVTSGVAVTSVTDLRVTGPTLGTPLFLTPKPANAGGDKGLIINAPVDPGALTTFTTSLRVKGGTLTFAAGSNQRVVQIDPGTIAATSPQSFSQIETLLVNGAAVAGTNATFVQSVGAKIVGGLVIDGTGSRGTVGDPIALNFGGGFAVFQPQISSPYGGDAGIGIAPEDGVAITHSTRSVGLKSNTIFPSVNYDQQMHFLVQRQTISGAYVMDLPATAWFAGPPLAAGGMVLTNAMTIYAATGNIGLSDDLVFYPSTTSRIRSGTVSLAIRDSTNAFDNLLITDAGVGTARAGLVATAGGVTATAGNITATAGDLVATAGNLSFGAASARIIPGATALLFRDTANANTNLTITDAGKVTTRSDFTFGGTLVTSLTGAPTITNLNAGVTSVTVTGNDVAGYFDIATNGSAPTANQRVCTVTFNSGSHYSVSPVVELTNGSQGANTTGALGTASWVGVPGCQVVSATAFDLYLNNGGMPNNATLRIHYTVTSRG